VPVVDPGLEFEPAAWSARCCNMLLARTPLVSPTGVREVSASLAELPVNTG
jgi:hypothetical protein